jgi:hypothetical protein
MWSANLDRVADLTVILHLKERKSDDRESSFNSAYNFHSAEISAAASYIGLEL